MKLFINSLLHTFSTFTLICLFHINSSAQSTIGQRSEIQLLQHGKEQFNNGQYLLAMQTLTDYLSATNLPIENNTNDVANFNYREARYFLILSKIKSNQPDCIAETTDYIYQTVNPAFRERASFALAQYYFARNDFENAVTYYQKAGIENLSNEEIADAKFELAYSYFNTKRFKDAKAQFSVIKEFPDHKYYNAGNYYFGLLAYNDQDYPNAIKSFERIHNLDEYKNIVPYYEAEIYYFTGDYKKTISIADRYLNRKEDNLYYQKDMHLLRAQSYFENKKYKEALPDFEYYYKNSDKIRKDTYYEIAFTYYKLGNIKEAIDKFKPLSIAKDSLGQTSMYLLGDCYLQTNDKTGARNAFGLCSEMNFIPEQKSAATFLYAKLSYDQGFENVAMQKLYEYVTLYPSGNFYEAANSLLAGLLAKSNNYDEAFVILSKLKNNNDYFSKSYNRSIYQQVAVGRAIQLLQKKEYKTADSILTLSLQQDENRTYTAIAYFWKAECAFLLDNPDAAIEYGNLFLSKAVGYEDVIQKTSPSVTAQNAHINLGYAHLDKAAFATAEKHFKSARQSKSHGYSDVLATDAILREADASYMLKNYNKADELYKEAIKNGTSNADYAWFQRSLLAGLKGDNNEKINILNKLSQKVPASKYKEQANFELGNTYLDEKQYAKAETIFNSLYQSTTNDKFKASALYKLAYTHQNNNQEDVAITRYEELLSQYPSSSDRAAALDALRNLYIIEGKPDKFLTFVKQNNLPTPDESIIELTYYDAAIAEFTKENYEHAINAFKVYLDKYPNGTYTIQANYYTGEAYLNLKDENNAFAAFNKVTDSDWSDFTEESSFKAGQIALKQKNYTDALRLFTILRNTAVSQKLLTVAYAGLVKSNYETGQYALAAAFADTLLTIPDLSKSDIANAQMHKARSLYQLGDYNNAMPLLETIAKQQNTSHDAEAAYYVAEILFKQAKYNEAEKQAVIAAKKSGNDEFRLGKCYILLGDIMTQQKDYFQAIATYESIVNRVKNEEIKAAAQQKLEQAKALEKDASKVEE